MSFPCFYRNFILDLKPVLVVEVVEGAVSILVTPVEER